MSALDEIRAERLKKLALLKEKGFNPYPAKTNRTHTIEEVVDSFEAQLKNLGGALSKKVEDLKEDLEKAALARRADETAKIRLQLDDKKDLRLDRRTRLATWVSIVIAILALAGTIVTLVITKGGK